MRVWAASPGPVPRSRTGSPAATGSWRELLPAQALVGFDVLGSCALHHLGGQRRRWAVLVPAALLQPVAHELLVERRLAAAGLVTVGGPEARAVRRQHFVNQNNLAAGESAPFEFRV